MRLWSPVRMGLSHMRIGKRRSLVHAEEIFHSLDDRKRIAEVLFRTGHHGKRDLERPGSPTSTRTATRDFSSLRYKFGTDLARANAPPKVAQALMRHSMITLTMDRHSHVWV